MDTVRIINYGVPQGSTDPGRPASVPAATSSAAGTTPSPAAAGSASTPDRPTPAHTSRQHMQNVLEQVRQLIKPERRSLSFEIDDDLGRPILSVYDTETRELVRQIPAEEMVRIAVAMQELVQQGESTGATAGLLLREQA